MKSYEEVLQERRRKIAAFFMDILRGLLAYLIFIALSTFLSFVFISGGRSIARDLNIDNVIYYAAASILMPLSYYSIMRTFELWDRTAQRAYPIGDEHIYKLRRGVKVMMTQPTVRRKLITHLLCTLIPLVLLPYQFGYRYLAYAILPVGTPDHVCKWITVAITAPVLSITMLIAKTSAHKWWVVGRETSRQQILESGSPNLHLALGILKVFIIYSISFLVFPAFILMLVTFALAGMLLTVWVWVAFIGVILTFIAIRLSVAAGKRRRAVNRIKRELTKSGWTVSRMHRPVSSLIIPRRGRDFYIEKGGKRYDCKLIGSTKRKRTMFISPRGHVTEKKSIGLMGHVFFHILTETNYAFEGENKLVIIAPVPYKIYVNYGRDDTAPDDGDGGDTATISQLMFAARGRALYGGGSSQTPLRGRSMFGPGYKSDLDRGTIKMMENGDRVGEYKFFSTSGFISAAGVGVLDREGK